MALITAPGAMALDFVVAFDGIHANVAHLPRGQVCGYDTGSSAIKWLAEDWARHPGAVHTDQDASASDPLSDILDVERGAATPANCARWVKAAEANFAAAKRPGQRRPGIYMSASAVTSVVNALIAGGVSGGVGLWVANWNLNQTQAVAEVLAASGPFPVIGVQFTDAPGFYDIDVFEGAWLADVSGAAPPKPPAAPGPFRHVTTKAQTLETLARSRHESVAALIANSAGSYTATDIAALGKLKLPAGVPFYTLNP